MSNITKLPLKLTPDTLDELLVEAANAHTIIPRLRAEAKKQYRPDHPMHNYVTGYHDELEAYIEHSTNAFEKLEDEEEETSIVGSLSLNEMKRRWTRLGERIALAETQGNITSIRRVTR
jgi:hypothetical protein